MSWCGAPYDHTHTTYTVHDSPSAHHPNTGTAACRYAYTRHITQPYSLHRWALVYTHRYKSKRATDFDVDKNDSYGEHLKKKKKCSLWEIFINRFIISSLYRLLSVKNFNKWFYKLSRTVHAYYSRTQPIFYENEIFSGWAALNCYLLNLNLWLDSCATVTILIHCVFFDLCRNVFHTGRITKYYYPIA